MNRRKNTEPPPIMSERDMRRMIDDIVGKDAWFSCEPDTQRRCYEFTLAEGMRELTMYLTYEHIASSVAGIDLDIRGMCEAFKA